MHCSQCTPSTVACLTNYFKLSESLFGVLEWGECEKLELFKVGSHWKWALHVLYIVQTGFLLCRYLKAHTEKYEIIAN